MYIRLYVMCMYVCMSMSAGDLNMLKTKMVSISKKRENTAHEYFLICTTAQYTMYVRILIKTRNVNFFSFIFNF